ncbi:MAG TPA: hypothetical protein VFY43_01615 [Candidatus Limnocylindria bacterium]|nr:hypothetical protein [Candidatus Limnocylindria bacterium]
MASEHLQTPPATAEPDSALAPITQLHDPRAIQILSTEHWSTLTARSLAYNEAFVRAGMFLTFLSMSFVGLALLADAMTFGPQFLTVAAIVIGFDLIVGLTTFERVSGANLDDLRALRGMARIRHGYIQAAPMLLPYFSTATHDDIDSVARDYNAPDGLGPAAIMYGLSTSLGMVGLVVSMLAGVEIGVVAQLLGADMTLAVWLAVIGALLVFVVLVASTVMRIPRAQAGLTARFPADPPSTDEPAETAG